MAAQKKRQSSDPPLDFGRSRLKQFAGNPTVHCANGSRVMSSKEYREFADECLHWAKTARSDREKRVFLQMAETWLKAAVVADSRGQRETTTINQPSSSDSAEA
jgi:hypothetical protein